MMLRTLLSSKNCLCPLLWNYCVWKTDTWKRSLTFLLVDEWGPNCKSSFAESQHIFRNWQYCDMICSVEIPVVAANLAVSFPQTDKICFMDVFVNTIFLKKIPQQASKKTPTKLEGETPMVSLSGKKKKIQTRTRKPNGESEGYIFGDMFHTSLFRF